MTTAQYTPDTIQNAAKQDSITRWLPYVLFVVTVLTRLPFTSQYLYHWDSVNMAFGLYEFNVLEEAPQFPGYIVYIALGQAINTIFADPQTTMVIISIVSSGLAAVALYALGRDIFDHRTGLIAAIFLITSPLVWFYGEIALPHTLDLFGITFAAWLLYRIKQGDTRHLWWTAVFLALLGGFRQQNLIFLGPLILFSIWAIGVRRIIIFTIIGAVVSLAWFLPLIHLSGGLDAFMAGSSAYSSRFFQSTSLLHGAGLVGLRRNLVSKLIPYTLYAWSLALLPAIIYWGVETAKHWRTRLSNPKVWFFLLWVGPALAFYTFIHMGQQGLVFVFLPVLFLLSAKGLLQIFQARPALQIATTAVIAGVGMGIFILGPTLPLGEDGPKLLTYSTLRDHDRRLQQTLLTIRDGFSPETTVILATDWRFYEYYLPDYALAQIDVGEKWEINEGQFANASFDVLSADQLDIEPRERWQIVLLVDNLPGFASSEHIQMLETSDGGEIKYLNLTPEEALSREDNTFRVIAYPME